jgi:hypothetical protein
MNLEASDKLIAQLQAFDRAAIACLPPAERRRLLEALEAAHRVVSVETIVANARDAEARQTGVLAILREGERSG